MAKYASRGRSLGSGAKRRGPTHRPSVWAGAISVFLAFFIIALRFLGDHLYQYPPNLEPHSIPKDTVIVCLAGGKHRIETAYSLFADGVGEKLWIIGAGKKSTVMGLARAQAVEVAQKIPWDRFEKIEVETESRNTLENAFAVKRLLEKFPGTKNLVLVTSSYHMRRAHLMIAHQIPSNINLIDFTPPNTEIERSNWWLSWTGVSITVAEFFKLQLASVLVPRLGYF